MHHAFLDRYAYLESFVHKLDPRMKLIAFFLLLLSIVLHDVLYPRLFIIYAAMISVLLFISRIPLSFILRKARSISLISVLIALPLPFFTAGEKLFSVSLPGGFALSISRPGMVLFLNVLGKSFLSILLLILLFNSTKFPDLMKAFEKLKVPAVMVLIVNFFYRYIFVLIDDMERMLVAMKSRGPRMGKFALFKTLGAILGNLFLRSFERAERVYMAMQARNFNGKMHTLQSFSISGGDLAFFFCVLLAITGVRFI